VQPPEQRGAERYGPFPDYSIAIKGSTVGPERRTENFWFGAHNPFMSTHTCPDVEF
jgi:hypothetical protein